MAVGRYVTGEVSTTVMKADEESVKVRSKLEAVENLLKDDRINDELQNEIRQHYHASQSINFVDQTILFRSVICMKD